MEIIYPTILVLSSGWPFTVNCICRRWPA
jgi:hypothetical protein